MNGMAIFETLGIAMAICLAALIIVVTAIIVSDTLVELNIGKIIANKIKNKLER